MRGTSQMLWILKKILPEHPKRKRLKKQGNFVHVTKDNIKGKKKQMKFKGPAFEI